MGEGRRKKGVGSTMPDSKTNKTPARTWEEREGRLVGRSVSGVYGLTTTSKPQHGGSREGWRN